MTLEMSLLQSNQLNQGSSSLWWRTKQTPSSNEEVLIAVNIHVTQSTTYKECSFRPKLYKKRNLLSTFYRFCCRWNSRSFSWNQFYFQLCFYPQWFQHLPWNRLGNLLDSHFQMIRVSLASVVWVMTPDMIYGLQAPRILPRLQMKTALPLIMMFQWV